MFRRNIFHPYSVSKRKRNKPAEAGGKLGTSTRYYNLEDLTHANHNYMALNIRFIIFSKFLSLTESKLRGRVSKEVTNGCKT
jgi:hypothetical protein